MTHVAENAAVRRGKNRPLKRVRKMKLVRFSSVFWWTRCAQLRGCDDAVTQNVIVVNVRDETQASTALRRRDSGLT